MQKSVWIWKPFLPGTDFIDKKNPVKFQEITFKAKAKIFEKAMVETSI